MQKSLLSSLRKYSPREKNDPLENFITEAFAWLLKNNLDFSEYFIDDIFSRMSIEFPNKDTGEWKTQCNFDGVFPDMVYYSNSDAIVFENKAWSKLHKNQLINYKNYAITHFTKSWVILITATKGQHTQSSDLALCWSDVYKIMSNWMKLGKDFSFIFEDFLQLLKDEGMGPPAPVSHESILYYFSAAKLENSIIDLMQRVKNNGWVPKTKNEVLKSWVEQRNKPILKKEWGRVGFTYLSWKPAIFVGVLLNGKDHCVKPSDINQGPDFCLILSFEKIHHKDYPINNYYLEFIESLESKIKNLDEGWSFYHHIRDSSVRKKNKYHPVYIRKPMLNVFAGSELAEEQEDIFCRTANMLVDLVGEEESFWSLRSSLK